MPITTPDVPAMPRESSFFLACSQVPHLRVRVIRTRAELETSRRNADIAHGLFVGLKRLKVVHVLIPELDDPKLISSHQDVLFGCPFHRLYGCIVRLQDVLEVELKAIPDRELASR